MGGKAKNMHAKVRRQRIHGRGGVDKTAVAGLKDRATGNMRARVVAATDGPTLWGFVTEHSVHGAMIYTDDHAAYRDLPRHQAVQHSVAEYVNGQAHVNGVESFWASLKRGYHGAHHHMSTKHLDRYVAEFCGRHNRRPLDTEDMMAASVRGMVGKLLIYAELTAKPGEPGQLELTLG